MMPSSDVLMTRVNFVVALMFLFSLLVEGAPLDADVKEFPGFSGELPSKHYAGIIPVGKHGESKRHMYYYFASSERNPAEDPITLWLTGGPGCSGLDALIHLVGPFLVDPSSVHFKKQPKLILNPYSWTQVSNILTVDAPAGVGYSYADDTDDYVTDDFRTVADIYEFLIKWYSEYPEFLSNPLYLAGCSYSGVTVPVVAHEIAKGIESGVEPKINLKGYSIGNGGYDVDFESNAHVPYAYKMGLISDEHFQDLVTSCEGKYHQNENPECLRNMENFQAHIKGINPFHILCLPCHFSMGISMTTEESESLRLYESIHGNTHHDVYCHEYEVVSERLFEPEASRKMLHAAPKEVSGTWIRCANKKRINYERVVWSTTQYHLNLTKKGYRAFIYNGDHDLVLPYTGVLQWLKSFNYSIINKWHPWFVDEQIAGYAVQFQPNILFATFKGAGHTVTEFMPREAFMAYQRWIDAADSL